MPLDRARDRGLPGYQRDHRVPLCRDGADAVGNMQWLTVEAHKDKTRGDCPRRR
jgi:hypothetical protein